MPLKVPRDREIFDHYRRFFGDVPWRFQDFTPITGNTERLYVLEFPPSADGDYTVYATVGMSRLPMPGSEDCSGGHGHRAELLLHARQPNPKLADALASVARYPFAHHTELAWTHTIAGIPGVGIVKGSPSQRYCLMCRPGLPSSRRSTMGMARRRECSWLSPSTPKNEP